MKNLTWLIILCISSILIKSCTKDDDINSYKLTEVIEDNGGNWTGFEWKKTLIFHDDGTVEIQNGTSCKWGDQKDSEIATFNSSESLIMGDCSRKYTKSSNGQKIFMEYPGLEYTYETYSKID